MLERYSNFICIHERLCSSNLSRTVLSNNGPLPKNQVASQVSDYRPGWKGRLLSMLGRETLVKTVLSSQAHLPHDRLPGV